MNNTYPIQSLLQQVSAINRKYEEIAAITGEHFNLFTIMRRETSEDWGHSAFIAELLSSTGSHGQGSKFLQLLLDYINRHLQLQAPSYLTAFDQYQVKIKKRIGQLNDDCTIGGEIDIYIESGDQCIIIENKIYAKDQKNQLLRYHNYASRKKRCWIFYLTLEGRKPEVFTTGTDLLLTDKVIALSYKEHILAWLELCKREVSDFPILRESLTQYIYLVKKLTNQSTNKKMESELIKTIIADNNSLTAALEVSQTICKIYDPLLDVLKKQLKERAESHGFRIKDDNWGTSTRKEPESYFYFYLPASKYDINITFGFDEKNCVGFSVGVYSDHEDLKSATPMFVKLQSEITEKLRFIGEHEVACQDKHLYVCYKLNNDNVLTTWTTNDIWIGIPNGQTANKLMELVFSIYESIKELGL